MVRVTVNWFDPSNSEKGCKVLKVVEDALRAAGLHSGTSIMNDPPQTWSIETREREIQNVDAPVAPASFCKEDPIYEKLAENDSYIICKISECLLVITNVGGNCQLKWIPIPAIQKGVKQ